MRQMILGIDPGVSGAVAFSLSTVEGVHTLAGIDAVKMPDSPEGIFDLLKRLMGGLDDTEFICFCEKTGTYRPGNSAPSAVKFARHCGHIDMALIAVDIKTHFITPYGWMKKVVPDCPKNKSKTDRKRHIKERMQVLYPDLKVTLATADALGILTYGLHPEW